MDEDTENVRSAFSYPKSTDSLASWVHLHVSMRALLETTFHLRARIPTVNSLFMHVHASLLDHH